MFSLNELVIATKGKLYGINTDTHIKGISIDSRFLKPQEAFVAITGKNFDGHNFIGEAIKKCAACVIVEETKFNKEDADLKVPFIVVRDTQMALGGIARFHRERFDIPFIAVTGSNGKTTTKDMISCVLSQKFRVLKNEGTKNNIIGLSRTLLGLNKKYEMAVLEIGTSHPGEVEPLAKVCLPNVGVITNIGPSHLEHLLHLDGVFKEKYSLIQNLNKPYLAVLNNDDDMLKALVERKNKVPFIVGFGIKRKSDILASNIKVSSRGITFSVNTASKFHLKTIGYHNVYNALAAIFIGRIFGLKDKDISGALKDFKFPYRRLTLVEFNSIKFIDDSYNANPLSLKAAMETLNNLKVKGRKILVMGDMLELGNSQEGFHHQAGIDASRICDVLLGVGEFSRLSAEAARQSGFDTGNIFTCDTSWQARDILYKTIAPKKEDVVLVKGSRAMCMENIFKL